MKKGAENIIKESLEDSSITKEKEEIVLSQVKDKLEKERTMKLSIKEGSTASVMSGLTGDYVTPYALALNASNAQIGFLSAFSGLIPPISQIFGSRVMEKYSRKQIIFLFVTLQALMWLPIALLSLFFWKNLLTNYLPAILIIFYTLYAVLGAIAGPSWFSLLGDIVPEKIRGKYFGRRNKICGFVTLISAMIAAFLLDYFKTKGLILLGFSILFVLASFFRLISATTFKKHYEPKLNLNKDYYFSIWQFIKKAPTNNFGRFVLFVASIYIGVTIAGPFFSVYMLKELGFSFTTYMFVNISGSIFSLLFMPIWGKFSDKYGNRELLKIGSIFVSLLPIMWVFSKSSLYIILVPQLISGIGWAAFNLAASNFIYDSVTPQRRGLCVAYYNILVGVGIFIGGSVGGYLAQYLYSSLVSKFILIFIISGLVRTLASLIFIPKIKEIKQVKKMGSSPLAYLHEIKPVTGVAYQLIDGVRQVNKKIRKIIKK